MKPIVIGTRGSQLAMWQAQWVADQLEAIGVSSRIKVIKTTGDKLSTRAIDKLVASTGVKGVFTKEIDEALIQGGVDIAVHSLKDLPAETDPRLELGAIPERGDARDAVVGAELKEFPEGARIGTSSLRRASQIRRLRPDLNVEEIRGNVDSRLKKLDEGRYEGLVLAAAGLQRLGLADRIAEILEPNVMCPAVGQGAIAIQIRAKDSGIREILKPLHHQETACAVIAERTLLATIGGGCQLPLGGHAAIQGDRLRLSAMIVSEDGRRAFVRVVEGSPTNPAALGRETAEKLLSLGAGEFMKAAAAAPRKIIKAIMSSAPAPAPAPSPGPAAAAKPASKPAAVSPPKKSTAKKAAAKKSTAKKTVAKKTSAKPKPAAAKSAAKKKPAAKKKTAASAKAASKPAVKTAAKKKAKKGRA
ncbi:MAG TPA: hydroxymethylbilane synthase [Bryobacterales bacterium]|nr:hydroxymethylbilane synthase [Bryobacterales bacterium]